LRIKAITGEEKTTSFNKNEDAYLVRIYLKGSLQNSIQTDYKQQIPTSNYD